MLIRIEQDMGYRLRLLPMLNIDATALKNLISHEGVTEPTVTCMRTMADLLGRAMKGKY